MEDGWSKVVCHWANGLDISTDVKNLMTLTDGKQRLFSSTKSKPDLLFF